MLKNEQTFRIIDIGYYALVLCDLLIFVQQWTIKIRRYVGPNIAYETTLYQGPNDKLQVTR